MKRCYILVPVLFYRCLLKSKDFAFKDQENFGSEKRLTVWESPKITLSIATGKHNNLIPTSIGLYHKTNPSF